MHFHGNMQWPLLQWATFRECHMWNFYAENFFAAVNRVFLWVGNAPLPFLLFTVVVPVFGFIGTVLFDWNRAGRTLPLKRAFKQALTAILVAVCLEALVWIGLLVAANVRMLYERQEDLRAENVSIASKLYRYQKEVYQETSQHCWMQNVALNPEPEMLRKGAKSKTLTAVYCRKKIVAPFMITVKFNAQPFLVSDLKFAAGRILSIFQKHGEQLVFAEVRSPSVDPFEMFVVNSYGLGSQAPEAIEINIVPVDPDKR
jgi:hypothetical protein